MKWLGLGVLITVSFLNVPSFGATPHELDQKFWNCKNVSKVAGALTVEESQNLEKHGGPDVLKMISTRQANLGNLSPEERAQFLSPENIIKMKQYSEKVEVAVGAVVDTVVDGIKNRQEKKQERIDKQGKPWKMADWLPLSWRKRVFEKSEGRNGSLTNSFLNYIGFKTAKYDYSQYFSDADLGQLVGMYMKELNDRKIAIANGGRNLSWSDSNYFERILTEIGTRNISDPAFFSEIEKVAASPGFDAVLLDYKRVPFGLSFLATVSFRESPEFVKHMLSIFKEKGPESFTMAIGIVSYQIGLVYHESYLDILEKSGVDIKTLRDVGYSLDESKPLIDTLEKALLTENSMTEKDPAKIAKITRMIARIKKD